MTTKEQIQFQKDLIVELQKECREKDSEIARLKSGCENCTTLRDAQVQLAEAQARISELSGDRDQITRKCVELERLLGFAAEEDKAQMSALAEARKTISELNNNKAYLHTVIKELEQERDSARQQGRREAFEEAGKKVDDVTKNHRKMSQGFSACVVRMIHQDLSAWFWNRAREAGGREGRGE